MTVMYQHSDGEPNGWANSAIQAAYTVVRTLTWCPSSTSCGAIRYSPAPSATTIASAIKVALNSRNNAHVYRANGQAQPRSELV